MDEGAAAQARERLSRWMQEGRELLALLPELLDLDHRHSARADHAEREAERLRKETIDLRKEALVVRDELADTKRSYENFAHEREELRKAMDELRREIEQLKGEKEEVAGAFAKLLDTVQSTNQVAQKLGVTRSPFARQRDPAVAPSTPAPQE